MSEPAPTTRIRLHVAYDGTDFSGWARQPGLRTVQGVLEEALDKLLRRTPPTPALVVAGRTDAGVHAADQVVHLDLDHEQVNALRHVRLPDGHPADAGAALAYRLNGILGASADVVVTRGGIAPEGFDARFSAVWRRYEYRVGDRPETRDPAQRHRTVWWPAALDADAMQSAAQGLIGLHDFAAYCKPREGATTIRTLQRFDWRRDGAGVLVAALQADAFCHSMVRALVGGCVAVGEGRLEASDLALILDVGARTSAFKVMPAKGLTLIEVGYPADGELAARAAATRARREL
ncbi:tRNA pseudouridine(38-40) synthase TruA [Gryllotalpicola protaetiae]|uniref:tRNA pseudouridine synthase A n=1 Tax=Gryllotalpicola protaetiae TaxID=2419771 RepID=A0A387BVY2_9MICO|nr:tRNA pseudouridine(38-40) synthase TruA [Gryllotalpicola protaetiae]AYG05276.1 tRNA pseudouridine(38-40) synthase TruA [Gryllotalpicola protaetiae]